MIIKNVNIYRETGEFEHGEIIIEGQFFAGASSIAECDVLDAKGCYAIPGLIDIHLHGCIGNDFSTADTEDCKKMLVFQAENGITTICPTTLTLPENKLAKACVNITAASDLKGSFIAGIHLEGPFFSYEKRGAQNPDYLKLPDEDMLLRLQTESNGKIKIVSIAPELKGAIEMINKLSSEIIFSIGHTQADYETVTKAFEAGAKNVTHLWSCMPPFHHRQPGVVGAARDFPDAYVEIICDSVHIHPGIVRATLEMFGDNRVVMISDSLAGTGLKNGIYSLGGLEVEVNGSLAKLAGTDTIAGSVTTLMGCFQTAVKDMGIPLCSAVRCCTENPAKALGMYDKIGSITPGKYADLVLLDKRLSVQSVILKGKHIK